jgi:hypothetical protein
MTKSVEPLHLVPDTTGAGATNVSRKPPLTAYLSDWMAEQRAKAEAPRIDAARAAQREALCRALGLAWIEPDRLDEYANEAGVSPKTLREVLSTEEGERIAVSMASKLRSSGEAAQVQGGRITESLLVLIERGIADGTVAVASAPKILDSISKLRGTADARNAKTPPPVLGVSVAELIGHD